MPVGDKLVDAELGRYFFALWPDGKTRGQCFELSKHHAPKKARLTVRENLHATLIFLGDQKAAALPVIKQSAALVQAGAFQLILDHMEVWQHSQVLSLCPSEIPKELVLLYQTLKQALDEAGIETEARRYRPHVTLARKLRQKIPIPKIVPIEWQVNEFVLVESIFEKGGVRYQVLDRWLLSS